MTTGKKGSPTRVDADFVARLRAWLDAQVIPRDWDARWIRGRRPGDTGWHVRDLARVLGIHETTLGRLINLRRASENTVNAVCAYTGLRGPTPDEDDGVWMLIGRRLRRHPDQYAEVLARLVAIADHADESDAQSRSLADLATRPVDRKR